MNRIDHQHLHLWTEQQLLREEISHFEKHLANINADDDCAYGKARIRAFEALLEEHRRRLDALIAAQPDR